MSVLVGKPAPDFKVPAVINGNQIVEDFTLSQFKGDKYVLLFFYPMDFTFVCPTEIMAFQDRLAEFEARGVQVIGASVDSEQSHFAWLQMPKGKGGIQGVTYPLIADFAKTVTRNYGVLAGEYSYDVDDNGNEISTFTGSPVAYRGTFLIDKQGIVRHQVVNDLPLGRSIEEALRMVDALIHVEQHGEVCPANWNQGKQAMTATHASVASYLSSN